MKQAIVGLIGVVLAGPAVAAGPTPATTEPVVIAAVPVETGPDWTGFYVGGQVGYGNGSADNVDGNGWLGGFNAGYRYDFGQWAAGAEFDYDFASMEADGNAGDFINAIYRLKFNAGVESGPALFYGTAGWAWAEADLGGDTRTGDGYFYGAGLSYALTANGFVSGELLQHVFDDFDGSGVDVDATTFTLRYDWKF